MYRSGSDLRKCLFLLSFLQYPVLDPPLELTRSVLQLLMWRLSTHVTSVNLRARLVIITLLIMLSISCDYRVTPVRCVRFDIGAGVTLNELAARLYESDDRFEIDNYDDTFTRRQQGVGQGWIVARRDKIEVSLMTHGDWGFTDICVYDHSGEDQTDQALEALEILTDVLDERNVSYEEP